MSERYLKATDVKKMISTNRSMKNYFPWAENMFLELVDELPEADVIPIEWLKQYMSVEMAAQKDFNEMLLVWRSENGN